MKKWDKPKVLELFQNLNFNRYIDRFSLRSGTNNEEPKKEEYKLQEKSLEEIIELIEKQKEMAFYLITEPDKENEEKIIKEKIVGISIYNKEKEEVYCLEIDSIGKLKEIFENEEIKKIGIDLSKIYILLKQENII